MKITDEILNKYIDGELTDSEISQLKEEISHNSEALKNLKAMKLTDRILRKMEIIPAPDNAVGSIMSKIISVPKRKEKIHPVFIGIFSFFLVSILGIIGFTVVSLAPEANSESAPAYFDQAKEYVTQNSGKLLDILTNDSVLFVAGMVSFILLIGFYFMINTHKSFKQNLERFSS